VNIFEKMSIFLYFGYFFYLKFYFLFFFLMKKLILSSITMFLPALAFADVAGTGTIVGWDRDTHGCIGSAWYSWDTTSSTCIRPWEQRSTGTGQSSTMAPIPRDASGSITPLPPKNLLWVGTKALETAMQNLSETDKAELAKTIRTFLESKGIKLPTTEEMQAKKGEIQQQKQEAKWEIKKARQEIQSARQDIKQTRQDLRQKRSPPYKKSTPPNNGTISGTVAQ
jgi:hypothetical protein